LWRLHGLISASNSVHQKIGQSVDVSLQVTRVARTFCFHPFRHRLKKQNIESSNESHKYITAALREKLNLFGLTVQITKLELNKINSPEL
jgi:hypothetical protein